MFSCVDIHIDSINSYEFRFFLFLVAENESMYKSSKGKRQRIDYEYTGKENFLFHEHISPVSDFSLESQFFPTNQLSEHIDELFPWLDEDNNKFNDFDGVDLGYLSTTMTEIDFF